MIQIRNYGLNKWFRLTVKEIRIVQVTMTKHDLGYCCLGCLFRVRVSVFENTWQFEC